MPVTMQKVRSFVDAHKAGGLGAQDVSSLVKLVAADPKNLTAAETMTLEQVIEIEASNMMRCSQSEDVREHFRASRDKREPEYKGM